MCVCVCVTLAQIPSTDQATGIASSEPRETLKGFRLDNILLSHKKPQGQVKCSSAPYKCMLIELNESSQQNCRL